MVTTSSPLNPFTALIAPAEALLEGFASQLYASQLSVLQSPTTSVTLGKALRLGGVIGELHYLLVTQQSAAIDWYARDDRASPDAQAHARRVANEQHYLERLKKRTAEKSIPGLLLRTARFRKPFSTYVELYTAYQVAMGTFLAQVGADLQRGYRPAHAAPKRKKRA